MSVWWYVRSRLWVENVSFHNLISVKITSELSGLKEAVICNLGIESDQKELK